MRIPIRLATGNKTSSSNMAATRTNGNVPVPPKFCVATTRAADSSWGVSIADGRRQ